MDLGFSRGGADFQKNFKNFVDLFFRSTNLIFRALLNHCFARFLTKLRRRQNFEKEAKKAFFGTFWKMTKKILKKKAKKNVFRHFLENVDPFRVGRGSNP